jgi:predicted ABC-type exoprotein transport system permease subunit
MLINPDVYQDMIGKVVDISGIDWTVVGIQFSSAVSAVCGIYATVVFCLCILYGKTALGLERDEEYFLFMENTGLQRFRALQAFSYGLFFWAFALVLVFIDHAPFVLQPPLFVGSIALLALAKMEYDILTAAAAPMFRPKNFNNRE